MEKSKFCGLFAHASIVFNIAVTVAVRSIDYVTRQKKIINKQKNVKTEDIERKTLKNRKWICSAFWSVFWPPLPEFSTSTFDVAMESSNILEFPSSRPFFASEVRPFPTTKA